MWCLRSMKAVPRVGNGLAAGTVAYRLVAVIGLSAVSPVAMFAQEVEWRHVLDGGPSPRSSFAMAYDADHGVTVLFGGQPGPVGVFGETWEWNGIWTQQGIGALAPSPRSFHAMVYDKQRQVTVLFGGYDNSPLSGETWEWSGDAWSKPFVTGPSPRRASVPCSHHLSRTIGPPSA